MQFYHQRGGKKSQARSEKRRPHQHQPQLQVSYLQQHKHKKLTLLQLIINYDQEGHRDHEEVEDEADLTELTDGRPTHLFHHRLVGALAADGWRVTQDDQTADQEHKGDLREWGET